jgi:hypothetical protein
MDEIDPGGLCFAQVGAATAGAAGSERCRHHERVLRYKIPTSSGARYVCDLVFRLLYEGESLAAHADPETPEVEEGPCEAGAHEEPTPDE